LSSGTIFPSPPGHTLIIPKRHVGSFFNVTVDEREAMLTPLDSAKLGLDAAFHSDADNIGIYGSTAAGQTVPHMYPHLIPR
jgi:diadenosine tetraphosphate (Ap4A) HIT family hydrolase